MKKIHLKYTFVFFFETSFVKFNGNKKQIWKWKVFLKKEWKNKLIEIIQIIYGLNIV